MQGKSKLTVCKNCGKEIAASAKTCPNCGGKNKKPIFKRQWFIIAAVIVIFVVIGAAMGSNENSSENTEGKTDKNTVSESTIEYVSYDVKALMDDLKSNALNAKEKYKDQYVSLTGKLNNIDSNGKYISLTPEDDDFAIIGVMCYIKNDEQLDKIMEMEIGNAITIKGKIKDVGEVIGYSLDIDVIE